MIHVFANEAELSQAVAAFFLKTAQEAVQFKGQFTVALTGGSSPKQLYRLLSQPPFLKEVPWEKTYVFWGDERWVPPDDPQYNAKMAFDLLLNHVPIPQDHIFPMSGLLPPSVSAQSYEDALRDHFKGSEPAFDLILLGMGDDGHTASLFPGTPALHENQRWVVENYIAEQDVYRITLTAPLINRAKQIAFLVFGPKKADTLYQVLETERNIDKFPAQLIKPVNGKLHWFVDEAAAANLE